jgi:ribosomal protein S18 acetylase RimI-like enzyme
MNMQIRNANLDDIAQIVDVHIKSFDGFFLTTLGRRFLTLLYQGFLETESGILRVSCIEQHICGFSAGSTVPETFFSDLRQKHWLKFFVAALPSLILNPIVVFKKLFHAIFYKGDGIETLQNAALLSSIAVDPHYSGKAVGSALLKDFEQQVYNKSGLEYVYLTTDKNSNDRVISFYTKALYFQDSQFSQSGKRIMLRFVKKISNKEVV